MGWLAFFILGPASTFIRYTPAPTHQRPKSDSGFGICSLRLTQGFCLGSSSSMGYFPTNIDQAMHSLSLSSPNEQYYMDTSATSHMTQSQGNLLYYSSFKHPLHNAIVVGNGHMIPVQGHG